jgi:hypothetical protein
MVCPAATSFVTTAPAPMTAPSPIWMPCNSVAPDPMTTIGLVCSSLFAHGSVPQKPAAR